MDRSCTESGVMKPFNFSKTFQATAQQLGYVPECQQKGNAAQHTLVRPAGSGIWQENDPLSEILTVVTVMPNTSPPPPTVKFNDVKKSSYGSPSSARGDFAAAQTSIEQNRFLDLSSTQQPMEDPSGDNHVW